jgi:hypothetical protein
MGEIVVGLFFSPSGMIRKIGEALEAARSRRKSAPWQARKTVARLLRGGSDLRPIEIGYAIPPMAAVLV